MELERTALEVGTSDLSIGEYSVGLAPARSAEQLVLAYLELISLVREDYPEYLRYEDIDTLAKQTGLERLFITNRINAHLGSIHSAPQARAI